MTMKKKKTGSLISRCAILITTVLLSACFLQPDISVPTFIPKSPPDSLIERGIDAHPDNAIYIEWEEPATAESEGILGYYVYRGVLVGEEYNFKRIATVNRGGGLLFDSDKYIDNGVSLDTTYYYYLRSYNDFTVSKTTSDTVFYKLARKASLSTPSGDIFDNRPKFEFTYPTLIVDRISYLYMRLYYFDSGGYHIKLFVKTHRFDLSKSKFNMYLENNDAHTTVLIDSLWQEPGGRKYLEKGNYRWRVDAISGELGGGPETVGSESNWMNFTVK
jgi:hypothetical protein